MYLAPGRVFPSKGKLMSKCGSKLADGRPASIHEFPACVGPGFRPLPPGRWSPHDPIDLESAFLRVYNGSRQSRRPHYARNWVRSRRSPSIATRRGGLPLPASPSPCRNIQQLPCRAAGGGRFASAVSAGDISCWPYIPRCGNLGQRQSAQSPCAHRTSPLALSTCCLACFRMHIPSCRTRTAGRAGSSGNDPVGIVSADAAVSAPVRKPGPFLSHWEVAAVVSGPFAASSDSFRVP